MSVKFPGKKCYVTREWPRMNLFMNAILSSFPEDQRARVVVVVLEPRSPRGGSTVDDRVHRRRTRQRKRILRLAGTDILKH